METLIKRVLYTGVGLVAATTDKVQQTVNNLVDKDRERQAEGKKIVDKFIKTTENRKETLEDRVKDNLEGILDKFDLVSKRDYEELTKKIQKLEKSQKARVKSATKTVAKKTSTAKKAAPKKTTTKRVTRKSAK